MRRKFAVVAATVAVGMLATGMGSSAHAEEPAQAQNIPCGSLGGFPPTWYQYWNNCGPGSDLIEIDWKFADNEQRCVPVGLTGIGFGGLINGARYLREC
ncbi:hypothetical protein [Amycolatopsis suaedae]|uniref:Uncharacterized protein n=1 Tax=Amycolatopsis suaedae TaxID=2510978 RepID=A0A4V2ELX5_9PSEU|nr:hypothetical protein [Amycolatopsis suaedae]RZQ63085.1 hypothetical protein EWH70_15475 [Amycolatopsis suaedae]